MRSGAVSFFHFFPFSLYTTFRSAQPTHDFSLLLDWCNVDGAGFGIRPSADTGSELADAFVWVKPGGESDGTSDESATRYDSFCGKPDAFKPSPEAGSWHQAYFEMLIKNAKPAF